MNRSVTKSKCGYAFNGKVWLQLDYSTTVTCNGVEPVLFTHGVCDQTTCAKTETGSSSTPYPYAGGGVYNPVSTVDTANTRVVTGKCFQPGSSTVYVDDIDNYTFANEYTTADLITLTLAALPSWGSTWDTADDTAFYDLSPDETSLTVRQLKYKFRWTDAPSTVIHWQVKFSPSDGGDPTYEDVCWAGSGTAVGPSFESPEFTIAPDENGTYEVVNYSIDCTAGATC